LNCQENQKLIHGYVDGELDLMKNLEIDQHLQECATCAQAFADLQAVRQAVKRGSLYFKPPSDLQKRVEFSLGRADQVRVAWRGGRRKWLPVAASLALGVIGGWSLATVFSSRSSDALLEQTLVANHVRSQLLPGHRVDVESSDRHTVKPWFEGKVDFSPPVPDLKDHEFILVGGRLDYFGDRAVATLVYQRRKHVINLFVWRSAEVAETTREATRQGYQLVHWTQAGLAYWAVSDLNKTELHEFVLLVREKS